MASMLDGVEMMLSNLLNQSDKFTRLKIGLMHNLLTGTAAVNP